LRIRFETLEEAQAYLDRWVTRWADTRIAVKINSSKASRIDSLVSAVRRTLMNVGTAW